MQGAGGPRRRRGVRLVGRSRADQDHCERGHGDGRNAQNAGSSRPGGLLLARHRSALYKSMRRQVAGYLSTWHLSGA
jgi:hypothetical protein